MSMARLWAARMIHAFGSWGRPKRHALMALSNASWTTSSASSMLRAPRTRISALTRWAYSRRNRSSTSSFDAGPGGSPTSSESVVLDRAHLDRAVELVGRAGASDLDGVLERGGFDDHVAGHEVLRFRVGTVGHHA